MAKAAWLRLSQESGQGDAKINIGSTFPYGGRKNRETTITWTTTTPGVDDVERKVIQIGRLSLGLYNTNINAPHLGVMARISGFSNAKGLKFELGDGDLEIKLPEYFTAAGEAILTTDGYIPGDPGESQQYEFEMFVEIPSNDGEDKYRKVIVRDVEGEAIAVCKLTSTGFDAYIEIEPAGDIILQPDGNDVTVTVKSNIYWYIE